MLDEPETLGLLGLLLLTQARRVARPDTDGSDATVAESAGGVWGWRADRTASAACGKGPPWRGFGQPGISWEVTANQDHGDVYVGDSRRAA
jgi:predicted RNA polymerase sigma factor